MNFKKALGVAIKNARSQAQVTSLKVEAEGIISRRALSSWETGEAPPNIERLNNLARFLGVSLSSIVAEAERLSQKPISK